jgi:hypothetical protein
MCRQVQENKARERFPLVRLTATLDRDLGRLLLALECGLHLDL